MPKQASKAHVYRDIRRWQASRRSRALGHKIGLPHDKAGLRKVAGEAAEEWAQAARKLLASCPRA